MKKIFNNLYIKFSIVVLASIFIATSAVFAIDIYINEDEVVNIHDEQRLGARQEGLWVTSGTALKTTDTLSGYNILINGTYKYLNFNSLIGSGGYGFRDNGGTMEWKNYSGSWEEIGTGGGGGSTDYLGSIGDVSTTTLDNGYVLKYNGSSWESVATSTLGFYNSLSDMTLATGNIYIGDASNHPIATSSLYVNEVGKIGIGTTTPDAKLHINTVGQNINPLLITTNGSAGNYTATNSAIFIRNAAGEELLRIYATDPDWLNNYNAANLYIGKEAGFSQPTDNVSAGYFNTGIGVFALQSNTTGAYNSALGVRALRANTTGNSNTALGMDALSYNTTGNYNSALGMRVLFSNTTGNYNSALGVGILNFNTTGSANTALGYRALYNSTISSSTAVGYNAGYSQTTGLYNTFLGYQAGYSATSSSGNMFMGYRAGYSNINQENAWGEDYRGGNSNTFIGTDAGYNLATSTGSTIIGYQAAKNATSSENYGFFWSTIIGHQAGLNIRGSYFDTIVGAGAYQNNTTGLENTAFGTYSLNGNTTGNRNSVFGAFSLPNTTGSNNNVFGAYALSSNTTGSRNDVMGYAAMLRNQTGNNNIAIGYAAGEGAYQASNISNNVLIGYNVGNELRTGGDNNILLGYQAGDALTTGANNILIGYDVDATSSASYKFLNIGNTIYGDLNAGNVGIGVTSPQYKLDVEGIISSGASGGNGELISYQTVGYYVSIKSDFTVANRSGIFRSNAGFFSYYNLLNGDVGMDAQFAGANLVFQIGSNEKMRVSNAGNVGIGTTSPTSKLSVQGTAGVSPLNIASSTGASILYVDRVGNVGIGTSTPQYALDTYGNSRIDGDLIVTTLDASVGEAVAGQFQSGDGALASLGYTFFNNDAVGFYLLDNTKFSIANNMIDALVIQDDGNVGIGTTSPFSKLSVQGTAGVSPLNIASSTGASLLYVNEVGNVGIGTTTPDKKLTVSGSSSFGDIIYNGVASGTMSIFMPDTSPFMSFRQTNSEGASHYGYNFAQDIAGKFLFQTVNNDVVANVLTIDRNNGNVGIGTTSNVIYTGLNANLAVFDNDSVAVSSVMGIGDTINFSSLQLSSQESGGPKIWQISHKQASPINSLNFQYNSGGGGGGWLDAAMTLTSAGKLGIGTTTPVYNFEVYNATATSTALIYSGGAGLGGRVILEDTDGAGCTEITTLNGTISGKTVNCFTGL